MRCSSVDSICWSLSNSVTKASSWASASARSTGKTVRFGETDIVVEDAASAATYARNRGVALLVRAGKGDRPRMLPLLAHTLTAAAEYLALRRDLLRGPDTPGRVDKVISDWSDNPEPIQGFRER